MAYRCDLTNKRHLVGNLVSHANNKTKMTQKPNLHTKKIFDPVTGRTYKIRLAASTLRTLDKVGGLAPFLQKRRSASNKKYSGGI